MRQARQRVNGHLNALRVVEGHGAQLRIFLPYKIQHVVKLRFDEFVAHVLPAPVVDYRSLDVHLRDTKRRPKACDTSWQALVAALMVAATTRVIRNC
jgi:hypothetical protein